MAVSGVAVGALAAGGLLVWSGLRGVSVLGAVQDIIQGKKPSLTKVNPISQPSPTPPGGHAPGAGVNGGSGSGGGIPGSGGVQLPRINPPNGANGITNQPGRFTDRGPAGTPKTAPPLPAPNPPTHIQQGTPYPWYDPRGWF